jgi:hypothetical protein
VYLKDVLLAGEVLEQCHMISALNSCITEGYLNFCGGSKSSNSLSRGHTGLCVNALFGFRCSRSCRTHCTPPSKAQWSGMEHRRYELLFVES